VQIDGDDATTTALVCSLTGLALVGSASSGYNGTHPYATELDSHANMPVAGGGTLVIARTGRHARVTPFSPELPSMDMVEILDVAMAYDDPVTLTTTILVMRNSLYVPTMDHNLIPPFVMREAGLTVDETPKFQLAGDATVDNHMIFDPATGLRIHLKLNGIFSYFPTRPLTSSEIESLDDYRLVYLTPDAEQWDPYRTSFADDEDAMVDVDGTIARYDRRPSSPIVGATLVAETYADPVTWECFEAAVDHACDLFDAPSTMFTDDDVIAFSTDGIRAQVAQLEGSLDPMIFSALVGESAHMSKVAMAMGSMTLDDSGCELFEPVVDTTGDTMAGKPGGVSAKKRLLKLFSISHDDAEWTLMVTSQLSCQSVDSTLLQNFETNDREIRYRRIDSIFFTDAFFVTAKARSTRGNICAQIYVSDKAFMDVHPMRDVKSFPLSLRRFAKEVGAPNVLVCDPHPSQKSREVKEFCNLIGTTLRVLEANTQWANCVELCVGLMKEATRKDMRKTNSPPVLWDYCMECQALIFKSR